MNLTQLAWRNIRRNPRRSIYISAIVGVATFFITIFAGFMDGFEKTMFDHLFDQSGHVRLIREGFADASDFDFIHYRLNLPPEDVAAIMAWPEVTRLERVLLSGVILSDNDQTLNMLAAAYAPAKARYQNYLIEGRYPEAGEAALGVDTAQLLQLTLGDTIFLIGQTKYESPNAVQLTLSGIFDTTVRDENERTALIHESDMRALLAFDADEWTLSSLHLRDKDAAAGLVGTHAAFFETRGIDARPWQDEFRSLLVMMDFSRGFMLVFYLTVLIVGATGIVNTILGTVFDRAKELGTMRALGMTPAKTRVLIFSENVILGIEGAIVGIALGAALVLYFQYNGISLMAEAMSDFEGVSGVIYTQLKGTRVLMTFALGLGAVIVSSWYPARLLLKRRIADLVGEDK